MPKVRASSGTIGTTRLPIFLSRTSVREHAHEGHRGRDLALAGALRAALEGVELRHLESGAWRAARRQVAAERLAPLAQVAISALSSAACRTAPPRAVVGIGMSKRSRKARSAFSPIFFCWWVMFWPSPASPMP
jgi:hypothetical protein